MVCFGANNFTCVKFLKKDESAIHILYDCEATAYLRFHHLGQCFMKPGDYQHTEI
jgi:hypothetical protein